MSPESVNRATKSPSENGDHDDSKHVEPSPQHEKQTDEKSHDDEKKEPTTETVDAPPLPDEEVPPLPDEAPPGTSTTDAAVVDDGWEPVWDPNAQAYYFYNRLTGLTQWENPRVPEATTAPSEPRPPGVEDTASYPAATPAVGGYNPAIHGDYDPTAPYAQQYEQDRYQGGTGGIGGDAAQQYVATGAFNRFTGKWQSASLRPENYNDENKSRRQMHAYFDVDAAANSHNGRSLKAERSGKKLSKAEVKAFREKRRSRKEEKRRAWLRD